MGKRVGGGGRRTTSARTAQGVAVPDKISINAGPWTRPGSIQSSRLGQVRSAVDRYDKQYGVQNVLLNGLGHIDILFSTRLNRQQVRGVQRGFRGIDSRSMDSDTGTSVRIFV